MSEEIVKETVKMSRITFGESFITRAIEAYRITIPKNIREKLGIQEGDMVEAIIIRKIEKSGVAPHVLTVENEKLQKEKESAVQ